MKLKFLDILSCIISKVVLKNERHFCQISTFFVNGRQFACFQHVKTFACFKYENRTSFVKNFFIKVLRYVFVK